MTASHRVRIPFDASTRSSRTTQATLLAAALSAAMPVATATTYTGAVTGVSAHDAPGGSGGYVPGYTIVPSGNRLNYVLANADRIAVATTAVADVARIICHVVPTIPPISASRTSVAANTGPLFRRTNLRKR